MEYYTAERIKEVLLFVTAWVELESIMLSEISQSVKDKYHMNSLITGTQYTNKKNRTQDMETENRLIAVGGKVGGRGL